MPLCHNINDLFFASLKLYCIITEKLCNILLFHLKKSHTYISSSNQGCNDISQDMTQSQYGIHVSLYSFGETLYLHHTIIVMM